MLATPKSNAMIRKPAKHMPTPSSQGSRLRLRSIGEISVLTLISRILGQLRSTLIAAFLATSSLGDSFTIALKIPNFLRSLVAEGAANAAFIPLLSASSTKPTQKNQSAGSLQEWFTFLFTLTLLSVVALTIAGIFISPLLAKLLYLPASLSDSADGWTKDMLTAHTGTLMRLAFPYLILIALSALLSSVLYTKGSFRAASAIPIVLNLSLIAAATVALIFFNDTPALRRQATFILAAAVVIGGMMQFAIIVLAFRHTGVSLKLSYKSLTRGRLRSFGRLIAPVTGSSLMRQLQLLLLDPIALSLGTGGVAALFFSNRLLEFPIALMVYPLLTAAFPDLSRYACNQRKLFEETFLKNLSLIVLLTLLAASGSLLVYENIVSLVFGFGAFSTESIALTASCFFFHLIALPIIAINRLLTQSLYALKRGNAILIATAVSLLGSVGASLLLIQFSAQVAMVALGAIVGAGLSLIVLMFSLSRSLSFSLPNKLLRLLLRYSLLLAVPVSATYALRRPLSLLIGTLAELPSESSLIIRKLFEASDILFTFAFLTGFSLMILHAVKIPEVEEVLASIRRRLTSQEK